MSRIQNAALVAEIVGGIGVILSLIFVGVQLRGNAALLEAQAVFDLREANGLLVRDLTANPELSELLYRGYQGRAALTEVENWRFNLWVNEVLRIRLIAWKYAEQGLLDVEEAESWRAVTCEYLQAYPGAREVWNSGGPYLRSDFRDQVNEWCFPG
jgi:hypothetical protein